LAGGLQRNRRRFRSAAVRSGREVQRDVVQQQAGIT
jgi:hypothetical protein